LQKQRERDDASLKTILQALNETQAYIAQWNAGTRDASPTTWMQKHYRAFRTAVQ